MTKTGALVIAFAGAMALYSLMGNQKVALVQEVTLVQLDTIPPRSPRLADGCLLVYLDVGANIGVHTRFLFEPDKYPEAREARSLFEKAFGKDRDNRDICAFGFEPNPNHKARHESLQAAYEKMGWRYHYIQAGASDHEGNLTFWHNGNDEKHNEWGFSSVKTKKGTPEEVPLVHLSNWIQHHIVERALPSTIHGQNYGDRVDPKQGKVVMKMDIEGAEYIVLPNLLLTGVFCRGLDVVFGEYHPNVAKHFSRPAMDAEYGKGELNLQKYKNAPRPRWFPVLAETIIKSINPQDCRGIWLTLDDESYLHDGVTFPKPLANNNSTDTATD